MLQIQHGFVSGPDDKICDSRYAISTDINLFILLSNTIYNVNMKLVLHLIIPSCNKIREITINSTARSNSY